MLFYMHNVIRSAYVKKVNLPVDWYILGCGLDYKMAARDVHVAHHLPWVRFRLFGFEGTSNRRLCKSTLLLLIQQRDFQIVYSFIYVLFCFVLLWDLH